MIVYVEKKVLEDPAISGDENFGAIAKSFCTFREGMKTGRLWCDCMDSIYLKKEKNQLGSIFNKKMYHLYFSDLDDISNCVDFIICLGGDGTLLYASSLFQVFSWVF